MNEGIVAGSKVLMHYTITLPDGTVADDSFEDEPLDFEIGDGTLTEGLEMALYGLKTGDTQELIIEPELAFGLHDPENIHTIPRDEFPKDLKPEEGLIIEFESPDGDDVPGAITKVTENDVLVDFNHPLAGKSLNFKVEILGVKNS